MKRLILALAVLVAVSASGQTLTLTSANFSDSTGRLITGTLTITPTLANGTPTAYILGGGGFRSGATVATYAQAGVIAVTVPDTALTAPANICLKLASTNPQIVLGSGYSCLQPASTGQTSWCTTVSNVTTCDLDNYIPPIAPLPTLTYVQSVNGCTGVCTVTGGGSGGSMTWPTFTGLAAYGGSSNWVNPTAAMVEAVLGFTPYNATNPSSYITSSALSPYLLSSAFTSVAIQSLLGSSVYDAYGAAASAQAASLQKSNNLSDLASASTARANLGLGTAATQATSAFDAAGAASTAQSTAETYAQSVNTTGTAANVTGTVALAHGGTGQTTQQTAINALAAAVTTGYYLRGNGTNVVMSAIQAADVPTLNQSTTGNAATSTALASTGSNGQYWGVSGGVQGWSTPSGSGGSGTVNSGTAGQLAYYASTGTAVSGEAVPTWNQNTTGTAANLSGTPALPNGTTGTTQTTGDNSTELATDAFVVANAGSGGSGIASINGNTTSAQTIGNSDGSVSVSSSGGTTSISLPTVNSAGIGYFVSNGALTMQGEALSNAAVAVANTVYVCQFVLPGSGSWAVGHASIYVSAAGSGATGNAGIYSSSGSKLIDSGSMSLAAATIEVEASFSDVVLTAGQVYYFAWAATSTTPTVGVLTMPSSAYSNLTLNKATTHCGTAANALSSGALPATLGTITAALPYAPLVIWEY